MTAPAPSARSAITPYRVVVSVLLAVAVVGVWYAFTSHNEVEAPVIRDSAVDVVEPAEGEHALRQDRIFVQLDPQYTGVLIVDGVEIPDDEINRAAGPNTLEYTPVQGSATGPLEPGLRHATVRFWELGKSREDGRSYSWSFNVS